MVWEGKVTWETDTVLLMSFNDDTELELPTGGDEQMALLEQMMAQMQSERAEAGAHRCRSGRA